MTASAHDPSGSALQLKTIDGDIALLTFDQPDSRVNTLGLALLEEFERVFDELSRQKGLQGLIFDSGKPGMFIAGADLRELGRADDSKQTRGLVKRGLDMIAKVESLPFPTVAVIDGACMGGGTELALGFDYRLAGTHPKVNIGLPEVNIGLIPGWGGTQRLSRIIGPALAAELICAGEGVSAQRARDLHIVFDMVPSDNLLDEAKRLLAWSRESEDWKNARKKKQQPVGVTEAQLGFTVAVTRGVVMSKTKGQLPAPLAALDAIAKGCNLPLEEGLKIETEAFIPLAGSTISKNLIAVFFMNQRLSKDPGVDEKNVKPKEITNVGVIGAGIMGAGIAGAHIRRGVPALMVDKFPQALEKGVGGIAKVLQSRVAIGRMTEQEVVGALTKLNTSGDLKMLADRDVIIEAVIEDEETKVGLFSFLQEIIKKDAILASNTSTISITRMAESVGNAERFAGMHFFNPVDRMRLVEVIRGAKTNDETVVTLVALAKKIGKTPIVVRDCPGFLVNRVLFPYLNESLVLLEEGADPRVLDKVAEKFGMPMGPITLNDMVGLDTSLFAGKVISTAFPDRAVASGIIADLVKAGRLGKKSGAGFYSYAKGGRGGDDPALQQILEKHRKKPKSHSEEELTERLFLPMLTEASRVLMEEIVRAPSDVDMGLILGIGFPAQRGGILRWADTVGLDNILKKLANYAKLGKRYEPTEQMQQLATAGKGFYPQ